MTYQAPIPSWVDWQEQQPLNVPTSAELLRLERLRSMAQSYELAAADRRKRASSKNRLHTGPRGGRYYIRKRADGTTFRDYT